MAKILSGAHPHPTPYKCCKRKRRQLVLPLSAQETTQTISLALDNELKTRDIRFLDPTTRCIPLASHEHLAEHLDRGRYFDAIENVSARIESFLTSVALSEDKNGYQKFIVMLLVWMLAVEHLVVEWPEAKMSGEELEMKGLAEKQWKRCYQLFPNHHLVAQWRFEQQT